MPYAHIPMQNINTNIASRTRSALGDIYVCVCEKVEARRNIEQKPYGYGATTYLLLYSQSIYFYSL
jgi:hypothetical protein